MSRPAVPTAAGRGAARGTRRSSAMSGGRRFPIGAEVLPEGGVHFRVWAPRRQSMSLLLGTGPELDLQTAAPAPMQSEEGGYFSLFLKDAKPGMFYKFRFTSGTFPDPASRCQPQGPHGPSQIIDPGQFTWTDQTWEGVRRDGQV